VPAGLLMSIARQTRAFGIHRTGFSLAESLAVGR
jgi:hypothetical protein